MEFEIETAELDKGMRRVVAVAGLSKVMPILSHVLIEADESVQLTAMNLEIVVTSHHAASVKKGGRACLPAKALADIARALPPGKATVAVDGKGRASISSGTSRFQLPTLSADEFPAAFEMKGAKRGKVDGCALLKAIHRTEHAMSHNESRLNLRGLHLCRRDGKVFSEATDGHRMAKATVAADVPGLSEVGCLIPPEGASEIRRMLEEAPDAEWSLGVSSSMVELARDGASLMARLVDAEFPDVDAVIPEGEAKSIFSREALVSALKRVTLLSDKGRTVDMSATAGVLRFESKRDDGGSASEDVGSIDGGPTNVSVAFDGRYLLDALSALDCERVACLMPPDAQTPIVIRTDGDESFLEIVMPTRM